MKIQVESRKSTPFAHMAPFAAQACDLLKPDSCFVLPSLCPLGGLQFTGKQEQTVTNRSLLPQAEDDIGTNCASNSPGATQQHPLPFLI